MWLDRVSNSGPLALVSDAISCQTNNIGPIAYEMTLFSEKHYWDNLPVDHFFIMDHYICISVKLRNSILCQK